MKLLSVLLLAAVSMCAAKASVISVNPIPTTLSLPAAPVATSYQVVSRNVNRVVVPHVPSITTSLAYPGYASTWGGYPYGYRGYGYGYGYPYGHVHGYGYGGYPYGYGTTVW